MSFVCKPPAQVLTCPFPNCSFKHADYKIPVEKPQSWKESGDVKPDVTVIYVRPTDNRVALKTSLTTTVSDYISSGTSQPPAKRQNVEAEVSQLKEENLRLTLTLSETKRKLVKLDAEMQGQRKFVKITNNFHRAQLDHSKVELNRLTLELSDQQQLNNRNAEEMSRQAILIEEKSELADSFRVQLRQKTEEVQRLNATIDQMEVDKSREVNENNRGLATNLPPVYPGWSSDFPDFNLISSDNFTFPVSRGLLSLKSAVFKADFSTDTAKKDGRVKTTFSSEVLLELLKFLCGQNLTENLRVVAVELCMAAEHYQQAELKGICEEEVVYQQQLSFESLLGTIRLANQLRSDLLMSKCFEFVKREKGSEKMWKDLGPIGTECPNLFGQIGAFSGSAKNAKCPQFHFNT